MLWGISIGDMTKRKIKVITDLKLSLPVADNFLDNQFKEHNPNHDAV